MKTKFPAFPYSFLAGGGEMGSLTRSMDWSRTPVGNPATWPQSLRTTINMILNSRFPMFLWWGPELICFYNDAYRPSLGEHGKHPSILGQPAEKAWTEIWDIIKPLIDQVLLGDSTWSEDQLIPIFRNGKLEDVYWTFSYSPVSDETGKPAGVLVICQETTEKVKILQNLKDREDQLRFTIDAADMGTWDLNPYTNKFTGNERLKHWLGLEPEEQIDLSLALDCIVEKDRQRVAAAIREALNPDSGGNYETEYSIINPKTGIKKRVLARGKAVFNGDRLASRFSGTLQDLTFERQAHEKLKENEERLNIVITASELGTWEWRLQTDEVIYSDRYLEIFGHEPGLVISHQALQDQIHLEDRPIRDLAFQKSLKTGTLRFEIRINWKDGSGHWIETRGRVFYNGDQQPEKLVGTLRDITDEKNRQRELEESGQKFRMLADSMEKQVRERTEELELKNSELNRMNSELESFAYISSHDLQEPLRKIQILSSFVVQKDYDSLSESAKEYFDRIQAAAKRMQVLISDLLMYSRTSHTDRVFELTDLSTIVTQVLRELTETIEEKKAIIELGPLCAIYVIPFQFSQLMHNLIGNSLKFSKEGSIPRIQITAEKVIPDMMLTNVFGNFTPYCHIRVLDNGIGFEPEYRERIFEVFQRLHNRSEYSGTGIGLSIVKKIVENHRGIINATGIPGEGACFDIYLPIENR
jgi:PAS domain S-box-containing protein